MFVLEELVRRLEIRIAIAALGASSAAILISRLFLGDAPDFQAAVSAQAATATGPLPYAVAATWPLYLTLGVVAGVAASLYNRTILGAIALAARLDARWRVEIQAAAIGALVGTIGWFAPGLIGGGDGITQRVLAGGAVIGMIPLAFALRFGLGAVCYAARTPGGLFAPCSCSAPSSGCYMARSVRRHSPVSASSPRPLPSSAWRRCLPALYRPR